MKPPEQEPELQKKQSEDSEDLDVTCDSSCGLRYHLHNHFLKVKKFFTKLFNKLKLLLL
jgi:hypothetical protein